MTLLEILVAIGVLGLITGLAFPELGHLRQGAVFRQANSLLASDMRWAHATAMRTDSDVIMVVGRNGRFYGIGNGRIRDLPDGMEVRARNVRELRFFGDGTTSGGSLILIGFQRRAALSVDPTTGNVVLEGAR